MFARAAWMLAVVGLVVGLSAQAAEARTTRPVIKSISTHSGKTTGGVKITIRGDHFTHVKSVKFGAKRGTRLKVISSHKITVVAPRLAPGLRHIRVVTTHGASRASKRDRYRTRTPKPTPAPVKASIPQLPVVTWITPNRGAFGGGEQVAIVGEGIYDVTRVTFGAATAEVLPDQTTVVGHGSGVTVIVPPLAPGTYPVHVDTKHGSAQDSAAARFTAVSDGTATITGVVTSAATGSPVSAATVDFRSATGAWVWATTTDTTGHYVVRGAAPGTYSVCAATEYVAPATGLIDACTGAYTYLDGGLTPPDLPTLTLNADHLTSVNFSLATGGEISGTVRESGTGKPLAEALVIATRTDGKYDGQQGLEAQTDAHGHYTMKGLPAGDYRVCAEMIFESSNYVTECYAQVIYPWGDSARPPADATPAQVTIGHDTPVNFSLQNGGSVSGIIVDSASGKPISDDTLISIPGAYGHASYTGEDGTFELTQLSTGVHTFCFDAFSVTEGADTYYPYYERCLDVAVTQGHTTNLGAVELTPLPH